MRGCGEMLGVKNLAHPIPLQNDPCQGSENCAILLDVDDRQERLACVFLMRSSVVM